MFLKEEERIETLKACRDCPMCHMTDTVAFITGSESNTPRGRAMTLWGLEKGLLSWESEGVQRILYQAFLDGLVWDRRSSPGYRGTFRNLETPGESPKSL